MANRNFDEWLSKFRMSISSCDYYVDFEKVVKNVDEIKVDKWNIDLSSLTSIPMNFRSNRTASTPVVPEPQKGSNITCPSAVAANTILSNRYSDFINLSL